MSELSVWKIEESETFWVVAESKEDAVVLLFEESYLEDWRTADEYIASGVADIVQMPDELTFGVTVDDEPKVTKTCAEWAKEGRAVIGSSVY